MRPLKTILGSAAVRRLLCALAAFYIRLVHATGRWSEVRGEVPRRFWDEGRPFIAGFWHGRLLMMTHAWRRGVPFHMLISKHRDGQLIADTIGYFGYRTVTGSTTRGGSGALRALLRVLAAGESVGITPDGPRGPRMRASEGVVSVARMSGAPIVPVSYGVSRGRVLTTWDRFLLPWPFARGVIVWGEPIALPRDADAAALAAARQRIEDAITAVTEEADRLTARAPVAPAPAPQEAAP